MFIRPREPRKALSMYCVLMQACVCVCVYVCIHINICFSHM